MKLAADCRDVDVFSFDMNTEDKDIVQYPTFGITLFCEPIPMDGCGVAWNSIGGFTIVLSEGSISFPYLIKFLLQKYGNDIDIDMRAGCVFTTYADTGFSGRDGNIFFERRKFLVENVLHLL